ncbi:family 1 glycosylhydrolase [Haliscomenobacter hydrossis]|uniref:Glycoside hydrolase family 1 n=1 Tax=Haliscomenobacter hydrossis (strain ATCC 27775 / DSM 1100 / LMG 10767 / O) TaxID=760192 RepID=F4KUS3_HALH1|nr:family 1 glycosylhydrolase [Haliscomenobacter hydrossis]AEE53476.1 glycoside hydrolase family 1 [Haliscomenobacter hydrossis DSM 1100]
MHGSKFMFATGIENSYPNILLPDGTTKRVDEMEKTGHYLQWERDFDLVKEMGIEFLRYGPPYYKTHTAPGKFDWSFTDLTFNRLQEMGITPLVDLCHFGVPDWLGNFQNPDFPFYFAEYASAFATRFPQLQFYTPINEIFIAAMFSAQYGWWNERLSSDEAFVNALKNLSKANVMAMHAILKIQPEATFIQSESTEYFHATEPKALPLARFLNQKRFLSLDLTYGFPLNVTMYEYLLQNGMTKSEYFWFAQNQVKARCIMGNDYYVTNEHLVHPDGHTQASGEVFGYYVLTNQYYNRYKLPIMHTETNIKMPACKEWLLKQWANLHRLKQDGVPIIGFTWYSLLHQVDWDSALRNDAGNINELGLYDLDRNIMPVGVAYKHLIKEWKDILLEESYGLLFQHH